MAAPKIVLVVNKSKAPVVFSRSTSASVIVPPLVLYPGSATPVDALEWKERKKQKMTQNYLEEGILEEVGKAPKIISQVDQTVELTIPGMLQNAPNGAGIKSTGVTVGDNLNK